MPGALYSIYFKINDTQGWNEAGIKSEIDKIAQQLDVPKDSIVYSSYYFSLISQKSIQYISVILGVSLVIAIISSIVIYSIFFVSVLERIGKYGQMRTLGMTKKQIRKIIKIEGNVLTLKGCFWGCVFGGIIAYFIQPKGWYLVNAKDRQLFLCAVLKNVEQMQGNMEIAKLEIKDMLNMDIPYFYSNTSKEDLYGSEGEVVKNYFAESSIQHLRNKICSMGKKDREEQIRFIKIILTDLNDVKVEKPKKDINELCISRSDNEHGQKEYKKNAILKILHTLEQKAFYGDDGQDINWIGITSIGNSENSSWNIQPLGVYLYEGLGGIALFYNALQQSDFDVDLSAACKAFETMMFQYTDDMLERSTDLEKESSGAYAGEASVIYVYEVLYKITGKQKYLEYAEKHCKILEYALKADENNDLIYGNAGAVIVLLNLYHLAQKDIYLQLACEAGNILIKNQNKGKWCCGNGQSLSGLSHGITGIIYALTKLNNEQFHIEYQKAIHSGLIYENTMYSDKYNNWLDNREEAKKEENSDNRCMAAWCHGAPGILLARSKMYNLVKDSSDYITVQCDIERALFATKMYGFTDNDCLCHGNLGNTEILLEYSKECNDEEVRHMMLSARTQIAMDIINENYDCARSYLHGYKIPGFMTGISGMGYSLLRDLYPELPCILALEI